MKQIIVGSVIIGASVICAALISSGELSFKDEHVIQLTGGAVKLGDIREEHKIVTVKLGFDDKGLDDTLVAQANMDEYKDALKDSLQKVADGLNATKKADDKKATFDSVSTKLPARIEITTAVTYSSEYQPRFTLTLGSKTIELKTDTNMYSAVTEATDNYIKEQKNNINQSLYLTDTNH